VFDHPTAAQLAEYVAAQVAGVSVNGHGGANGSSPHAVAEPEGMFASLMREAHAHGRAGEFFGMLSTAAEFRPTFDLEEAAEHAPRPIRLAAGVPGGSEALRVVCIPSMLAVSGPHQYVRFAAALGDMRETIALTLPGFREGERLPATMEALIAANAEAMRHASADRRRCVLAGHSTGGAFALALASRLEAEGEPPAGVILIDTYTLGAEGLQEILEGVLDGMLERGATGVGMSDARLTAMGAYLRLLADWQAPPVQTRTLLLRAAELMPALSATGADGQTWRSFDDSVEAPGDHFTMMEEHADAVAHAVDTWLSDTLENRREGGL
jgi:thioesterase domain-containing protein